MALFGRSLLPARSGDVHAAGPGAPPERDLPATLRLFPRRSRGAQRTSRTCGCPTGRSVGCSSHPWPGNLRQVRNTLERALITQPAASALDPRAAARTWRARPRSLDAVEKRADRGGARLHAGPPGAGGRLWASVARRSGRNARSTAFHEGPLHDGRLGRLRLLLPGRPGMQSSSGLDARAGVGGPPLELSFSMQLRASPRCADRRSRPRAGAHSAAAPRRFVNLDDGENAASPSRCSRSALKRASLSASERSTEPCR